jgi:DNA polymerase-3 subunit delta
MTDPVHALVKNIGLGKLQPVYVLYGEEPAAIRAVVGALRKFMIPPDDALAQSMAAFNHERFDGADLKGAGGVIASCQQVPMMAKRRLVELANPEDIAKGGGEDAGSPAAAIDTLANYMKSPSPTTVLVITSMGIDGRSKLVTACKKEGWAHKFEALKRDDEAAAFVAVEAQARGKGIARDAANALVAAVGTGRSELLAALEQAALHAGERQVTVADVEAMVVNTREGNIFHLTDAVGRGEARTALAVLARMFSSGEKETGTSLQVLAMLTRQIRMLYTAKVGAGHTIKPEFLQRQYESQARGFSEARLRTAYAALVRLDSDLKGGSAAAYASPFMAIQRWILDTCGALPGVDPRV